VDKRERRRVRRARLRKGRARHETQVKQAAARLCRAGDLEEAAARSIRERDWAAAVERAARAVVLLPRDPTIAALYLRAAEGSRVVQHRIGALEHLASVIPPTPALLCELAELHRQAGDAERARCLFEQASRLLASTKPARRGAAARLAEIAARLDAGAPEPPAAPDDVPPALRLTPAPAFPPPPEPEAPAAAPTPLEVPVTLAADISRLDVLGDQPGSPADITLALMATALADAESFDRLLSLERAAGLLRLSHQEETARKVLTVFLGRALLADEVGLGKTIEAGLVLSEYLLRGRVRRALVLAPPTLVGQWREELASKFAIETCGTDDPTPWDRDGVVVASLATVRSERHRDAVIARPWDLVIVDEAHTLKNHRTESYALVERLKMRFLLLLTATPVENRVEELYNLVNLLRPGHLGGRAQFVRRFADGRGQRSEAGRDELRHLLAEVMVRNTRALSGVMLPPRFARTLLVEPGAEEHGLYEALAGALRSLAVDGRHRQLLSLLLQEAGSSPFAVRGTLDRLLANGALPEPIRHALAGAVEFAGRATASEKATALLRALAAAPGPAIVFTRFRGTLGFLAEVLGRAGVRFERLDGDVPVAARAAAVERCREGGVLLATDVGSEGLNLQFCHRLVNFDLPWNPMRIEQRIGRLHRIGQTEPVEVLNLCLAGSIEERILTVLDERINLFELIVGEVEMILGYLAGGRDFPELALDAFAHREEADRARSFERLGDALAAARQRYRSVKTFDDALFRSELGV
jgi:hypothetical protein